MILSEFVIHLISIHHEPGCFCRSEFSVYGNRLGDYKEDRRCVDARNKLTEESAK